MVSRFGMIALVILIAGFSSLSFGADTIYVTIVGAKQGPFKAVNHKDQFVANHFEGDIKTVDTSTGQASGKRQYSPISVTFPGASAQILQALVNDEVLKTVQFQFIRSNPTGKDAAYLTITLSNAKVTEIHDSSATGELEETVSFSYQKLDLQSPEEPASPIGTSK